MNRFELIDALEGRFIPNPKGDWLLVENGQAETEYGPANLMQYETGMLEQMYLKSFNFERLCWLYGDLSGTILHRYGAVREANLWWAALRPHFDSKQLPIGMIADMAGRRYA